MAPNIEEESIEFHKKFPGKTKIVPMMKITSMKDLSLAYTPGVAGPCNEIVKDRRAAYTLTGKKNRAAVISDGTRVLGLGNIGPLAALPVMEGKALLLNVFGGVDAVALCIDERDEDEFVKTVVRLAPSFGAILLEDIESPKCFRVEKRIAEKLDIPVFHDDQHGTAVVVLAGLVNALKLAGKKEKKAKIIVNGAGAAGCAIAKLLHAFGFENIFVVDLNGLIYAGRGELDEYKEELASYCSIKEKKTLAEVLAGADVFIGVSAPNLLKATDIKKMANKPIVFSLANPYPEITREEALAGGAFVYGSARSDWPNQVNNLLAFPGIFRGLLDAGAKKVNDKMKISAALAIAKVAQENGLERDRIVPDALNMKVHEAVAKAICKSAKEEGLARN